MQNFTNEVIDLDQLPKYEEITLTSPHPRYWNVMMFNIGIFFLVSGTALGILLVVNKAAKPYFYPILIAYIVILVFTFILYYLSFKKRGFALREKDIIYKSGIIAESTQIIPLNRIQHVALDEGLFSRMYNLATLDIHTAGGSSGHMKIAGIPVESAKIIKEALIKRLDLLETEAAAQ
jgi:membrane protein YdbS with pleckstrin-like domain